MLKKTITYTDFNGIEQKEDFYFNLTKAELAEMDLSASGGMQNMINQITNSRNNAEILSLFKSIILKAYGEKSADGKYFKKSEEITQNFASTEAYSELFMELASDDKAAAAFINGIVPSAVAKKMTETPALVEVTGNA